MAGWTDVRLWWLQWEEELFYSRVEVGGGRGGWTWWADVVGVLFGLSNSARHPLKLCLRFNDQQGLWEDAGAGVVVVVAAATAVRAESSTESTRFRRRGAVV